MPASGFLITRDDAANPFLDGDDAARPRDLLYLVRAQHILHALDALPLADRRFDVVIPELPDPENPDRDAWTKAVLDAAAPIDDQTIIVGHSLGGATALRFLEAAEARSTPHAMVLIATPWMIRDERFRGFFLSELDFEVLMWRASKFAVIHAKDDPVIPIEHGRKYAAALHARFVETESGGHFQQADAYPVILDTIVALAEEPVVYAPGETLAHEYADITV